MARMDSKERQILRSVERGEWRSGASKAAVKRYVEAARQAVKKDQRAYTRSSSPKR